MTPVGHIFYVFSDVGQRSLWSPLDLAEHHRNRAIEKMRFPRDQAASGSYDRPGIIKSVHDGFVYYTVAEKIQDAFGRAALAAHTIVFSVEELMEDGGALLPPSCKEEYQVLGLPSELHSKGRRLADIQRAIDECVAMSEIRTTQVSPGWHTRELNWLLANPRSIISDQGDDFPAESAIGEVLAGVPPPVSAAITFAARYAPSAGGYHLEAYSGSSNPTSPRGVSIFRSGSSFKAAIESAPAEEVLETDREREYRLALKVTGGDPLEVLDAFRNGSYREGATTETVVAVLIAEALSADGHPQLTLDALERNIGGIKELPRIDQDTIVDALSALTHGFGSPKGQSERLISALSPRVSVPPASQGEAVIAHGSLGRQDIPAGSASPKIPIGDIDDIRVALEELKLTIEADLGRGNDSKASVETVSDSVRTFTELVIAGSPDLLKSKDLPELVQALWQEIDRWGRRGSRRGGNGRERPRLIREVFGYRREPGGSSLFDDLMYITWQTRHVKDHADKVEAYSKLMDKVFGQDRPFWR